MTEIKPKKKMGRPKGSTKAKKGAMIWCPEFCLDMVQAIIETAKQQQKQSKTQ